MKQILRVEHKDSGIGIWRAKAKPLGEEYVNMLTNYEEFSSRHNHFPLPFEDKKIKRFINLDEFCAFKSVDSFREWITTEEIKEFIAMGFKVLLLDVSECVEGEYQILYKKENILQTKDISQLFN